MKMELSDLGIKGHWLVANCGKIPSEMNCRVVMMAPEEQREDWNKRRSIYVT